MSYAFNDDMITYKTHNRHMITAHTHLLVVGPPSSAQPKTLKLRRSINITVQMTAVIEYNITLNTTLPVGTTNFVPCKIKNIKVKLIGKIG